MQTCTDTLTHTQSQRALCGAIWQNGQEQQNEVVDSMQDERMQTFVFEKD